MQIRPFQAADTERVIEIWLEGSRQAHDFIDPAYWEGQTGEMSDRYLPMSQTELLVDGDRIVGFISMVGEYIAALFIDPNEQRRGYGRKLLDHVKQSGDRLELKVYRRNDQAVRFYQKNGFIIADESRDEATSEPEWVMRWNNTDERKKSH